MKKKFLAVVMTAICAVSALAGCGANVSVTTESTTTTETTEATEEENADVAADGAVYKVGIIQYVDDASLNQIVANVESKLDEIGAAQGVTFNYQDYYFNGQADATTLNQIVTELINDEVDILVPIATPTALICQSATEDNQIPVVFSAVSDPEGAGLVASNDAPGSNITGTSDALNTNAVMDLMFAANPEITKVGLLYDKSQDSSDKPIAEAKAYLDAKGVEYVEKTGTTNDEVMLAADALIAEGVQATFTPTDNTIMTAELAIFEKFMDAGVAQYCGADSFALNGAFCGYGVNYSVLGQETAEMVADILLNGANPAETKVRIMDNGTATVNTETAAAIGLSYDMFKDMCAEVVETTTKEEFDN
ncbi:MAG: ABC transporter substrate-binding protein [Lachnospiraceae bacterium]|nr:ABC transporter substrate-binding protein [Lachnospiraceae bacterium]